MSESTGEPVISASTATNEQDGRTVMTALIQTYGSEDREDMRSRQVALIEKAAITGAELVCLQELAFSPYFCSQTDPVWFEWAEPIPSGPTVKVLQDVAAAYSVVIVAPMFEHDHGRFFNTAAVVDADGTYVGRYRKAHIPDAEGFRERYYFEGGDEGFPVFTTAVARIGVYICHDRHYPEGARILGLKGAQIVFIPSATSGPDSEQRWRIEQRATAIANGYFVGTINRTGQEPTGGHHFFGQSYFADPFGRMLAVAGREEEVLVVPLDLKSIGAARRSLPVYEVRRPEMYSLIAEDGLEKRSSE